MRKAPVKQTAPPTKTGPGLKTAVSIKTTESKIKQAPLKPKEFDINDYITRDMPREEVLEFKTAFDMFEPNAQGLVEIAQVKEAFKNLGFHQQDPFSERVLDYLADKNKGYLNFGQFIRIATSRLSEKSTQQQADLAFTTFDYKNTGQFNNYDFKDAARDLGEDLPEEELDRIFDNADADKDGLVTREDFYNLVTRNKK